MHNIAMIFLSYFSSPLINAVEYPKITQNTLVSQSLLTLTPIVTPRVTQREGTQIKVRKDIYSSSSTTAPLTNSNGTTGFEEMVKSLATNVVDTKMSGITKQSQVRCLAYLKIQLSFIHFHTLDLNLFCRFSAATAWLCKCFSSVL